ncbi:hypothetical protein PDJAM_G00258050 [Pangasius djambal]|uniref:Uncharacterized protein n=1 Tax=Pangasius djambal TaxID=1691987 RepID=A0ACC5YN77_9TELE|nr:hypothetical protein [Pangasius djambal]
MEKYRDGQRELHCVFVDLEKAYDRVPREELWYCMRKSGVAEKYVRVVQDMYERSRTVVRCAVGQTEEFKVEVGLHQGSALSPFLFAMVMDQLSEEVRQESPYKMMFADDIVICSESREQVEENLERWRFALERRKMKVSRSKTEYMCVNEREGSGTVRLQGEEVKKVQVFKYLGSTVQSNGECGKEVKKRVQAGWNGWRKVSGVLCDRKISARTKGKVYKTVVRAAMLYGLETVALRKRQESELEVAELKMLRFSLGVTSKRNGVGVVLKEEFGRNVLEVKRVSDRVMSLKLEIEGVMLNVVCGYAPQVGCELEEKERFWSELDEVIESIPTGERVVIGADFNGHVGEGNTGDKEVMGKFGVKERNLEGQMVVDFAKRMDMAVVNTYFHKREEHRVTYKSGGRSTQVDYILCRRGSLKEISDCKVVVGESVARQHRMVVCRMTLMVCKKKRSKIQIEKKTKWWKLKKEECCEDFRQKLRQALGGQVVLPDDWETTAEVIRVTGRKVLGAGFKLFYYGVDSKRNGVGVVLKEEFGRNVLEVKRVSDRVMSLKLEIEGVMLNVVSGYAPQVGCEVEEKERFWSELDEVIESIPTGERVVIGADFNGHVGEGNTGDEEVMGKFGVKERNLEGQMVVDFAKTMDMAVVNTYFQKREEHRVT